MGSIQLALWNVALRLDKNRRSGAWERLTPGAARRMFEKTTGRLPVPNALKWQAGELGGVYGKWMGKPFESNTPAILYFHGGGYVIGSSVSHLNLTLRLGQLSGAALFSADYRLAPEHPYPAAVEDAVACYRALLSTHKPEQIAFAGDSAGGGLALAALLAARDQGLPMPAAACLFSPWVDLTFKGASYRIKRNAEVMIHPDELPMMARMYLQGQEALQAYASPLWADLSGLPPLLVQASQSEILLDDSVRLTERIRDLNGSAILETWKNTPHVWQIFAGWMPEGDQALKSAAAFLKTRWQSWQ